MSEANVNRNYRTLEEFAMHMVNYAPNAEFEIKTEENIYAFDSSIISFCLSVFWWAAHGVIIAYCLVTIVAKELKIDWHIYTILQIVNFSLYDKTPIKQLFTTNDYKNVKEQDYNLLLFS